MSIACCSAFIFLANYRELKIFESKSLTLKWSSSSCKRLITLFFHSPFVRYEAMIFAVIFLSAHTFPPLFEISLGVLSMRTAKSDVHSSWRAIFSYLLICSYSFYERAAAGKVHRNYDLINCMRYFPDIIGIIISI
jgi:hypothetical protein